MHEEHACKLHQAPSHHPRGLHIRWQRVLDTTGRNIGNCCIGHNDNSLPQDGTYSFADFTTAFEEYDVQRVIRSYENSISISVHCCQEGEWKQVILLLNFYEGFKVLLFQLCFMPAHKMPLLRTKAPPFRVDNVYFAKQGKLTINNPARM